MQSYNVSKISFPRCSCQIFQGLDQMPVEELPFKACSFHYKVGIYIDGVKWESVLVYSSDRGADIIYDVLNATVIKYEAWRGDITSINFYLRMGVEHGNTLVESRSRWGLKVPVEYSFPFQLEIEDFLLTSCKSFLNEINYEEPICEHFTLCSVECFDRSGQFINK